MRDATRRVATVVAILLVLSTLGISLLSARAGSVAGTTASVVPVDRDGSGKWDTLLVNVTMNVTVSGLFEIAAIFPVLHSDMPSVSTASADVNLTAGIRTVPLVLDATVAGRPGAQGPYTIDLSGATVSYTGAVTQLFDLPAYTPPWNASSFDPPAVSVSGTITDSGVNVNGDGLYDELVVHVPLQVVRPTVVSITGTLPPVPNNPAPARFLQPGRTIWDVVFDGAAIRHYEGNGRYPVTLTVSGPRGSTFSMTYETQTYSALQFAKPMADFEGLPTVTSVDANGNGKAEFLRVHVPLLVRLAGDFQIMVLANTSTAMLPPPAPERHVHLEAGDQSVDVDLSGIQLSRFAAASPMTFAVTVFPRYDGSPASWFGNSTRITYAAFDPTLFEARPPEPLYYHVNGTNAYLIGAMDPVTKFVAIFPSRGPIDNLTLYNGTFDALLGGPGFASRVVSVQVQGYTVINVTSLSQGDPQIMETLNLTSWASGTMDKTLRIGGLSPELSWWADVFGNIDGTADAEELALFPFYGYSWYSAYISLIDEFLPLSGAGVAVDDTPLAALTSLVTGTGAGSLEASHSVSLSFRDSLGAMGPLEASGFHKLTVDTTLMPDLFGRPFRETLTVNLPAGASGNLSASNHVATPHGGFDLATNATVSILGPASWTITFGPGTFYYPRSVTRVTVAAYQPPAALDVVTLVAVFLVPIAVVVAVAVLLLRRRRKPTAPPPKQA